MNQQHQHLNNKTMNREALQADILAFLSVKVKGKKGVEEIAEKHLTSFFKEKYTAINPETKEVENETRDFARRLRRVIDKLVQDRKITASGQNHLDEPYWEGNEPTKYRKATEVNIYATLIQ